MDIAVAVIVIVFLFVSRKIWNSFIKTKSDEVLLWAKDEELELQDRIKDLYDRQESVILKNEKWYTTKDLDRK